MEFLCIARISILSLTHTSYYCVPSSCFVHSDLPSNFPAHHPPSPSEHLPEDGTEAHFVLNLRYHSARLPSVYEFLPASLPLD